MKQDRIIPVDKIKQLRFGQLLICALVDSGHVKQYFSHDNPGNIVYEMVSQDLFYIDNDHLEGIIQKFLDKSELGLIHEFINQSNLIEGYDNPAIDEISLSAWQFLISQNKLTHQIVQKVQKIITSFQDDLKPSEKGSYRRINVAIGGKLAPSWPMVLGLMDNWLLDYGDPIKDFDPKEAHIKFEHAHSFVDGNGRTGRMLLNWHRVKKGLPILVVYNSEKQDYYKWFREKV